MRSLWRPLLDYLYTASGPGGLTSWLLSAVWRAAHGSVVACASASVRRRTRTSFFAYALSSSVNSESPSSKFCPP